MKKAIITLIIAVALGTIYFAWALVSSPTGSQTVAYAPAKRDCFSVESPRPWKYCVHVPAEGKPNGDLAYVLHGRNLDESIWNDNTFYTAMIQNYWQTRKIAPPTVVTVSFGPVWLLTEKGSKERSGLLDVFRDEVIPEVEKRIGRPKRRLILGESMGGLNTLALVLKTPSVFQKAASLCPAIYIGSPFAPLAEIREFMSRTGANPKNVFGIRLIAMDYFANQTEWERAAPLTLLEQVEAAKLPELYLSCGLYDPYGNFEGNERFARRAAERGVRISWHPLYGGHCAIDIPSLAEFLVN